MVACSTYGKPTDIDPVRHTITKRYTGPYPDLCRGCRLRKVQDLYASFTDWEELLGGNMAFLLGKIDCTPSHPGPLCRHYESIVPGLVKLHDYGIVTFLSQPFKNSLECGTRTDGKMLWLHSKRRPFLRFLIPTLHPAIPVDKVDRLVSKTFAHAFLRVLVYSQTDQYPVYPDCVPYSIVLPVDDAGETNTYHFRTNAEPWSDETVIKYRADLIAERLQSKPWIEGPCINLTDVGDIQGKQWCGRDQRGNMFHVIKNMRPLAITVVAAKWDAMLNLQEILQELCEEAGLGRVFGRDAVLAGRQIAR
jgi:hypothetical protein